ncbi:MAG: hypothetical protein ABGX15_06870 [Paracoccaceae bacterium]
MNAQHLGGSTGQGAQIDLCERLKRQNETILAQNTALAMKQSEMRRLVEDLKAPAEAPDTTALEAENARLSDALAQRAHELGVLTRKLEEARAEDPRTMAELRAELEELRGYTAGLEYTHLTVLTSTSWRLTRALRGFVRRLKGQPRPAPFAPRFLDYNG